MLVLLRVGTRVLEVTYVARAVFRMSRSCNMNRMMCACFRNVTCDGVVSVGEQVHS